jgi:hypothetical protein
MQCLLYSIAKSCVLSLESNGVHNAATASAVTTKQQIKNSFHLHLLQPPTRAIEPLYMPTGTQLPAHRVTILMLPTEQRIHTNSNS